jgi:hypothetical protein
LFGLDSLLHFALCSFALCIQAKRGFQETAIDSRIRFPVYGARFYQDHRSGQYLLFWGFILRGYEAILQNKANLPHRRRPETTVNLF